MTKTLHRAAGRFTTSRGTSDVMHFVKIPNHMLLSSTDLYEVILYRSFRRAIDDGSIESLKITGDLFYLYLASLLSEIIATTTTPSVTISHGNENLGTMVEGLKLVSQLKSSKPISYCSRFKDDADEVAFNLLHKVTDKLPSRVSIIEGADAERMSETETTHITICDHFKKPGESLRGVLEEFAGSKGRANNAFVIARVMATISTPIVDIYQNSADLPSIPNITEWCASLGVRASYIFLDDFDRDFLLPFDGEYGLIVLHLVRGDAVPCARAGFRELGQDHATGNRGLVVVDQSRASTSYDSLFTYELPELQDIPEPDWRTWGGQDDIDLSAVDWSAGANSADPVIMALFLPPPTPQATAQLVQKIAAADKNMRWLSVNALVHAFVMLREHFPAVALSILLRAIQDCRQDLNAIEYCRRVVRFYTGKDVAWPALWSSGPGRPIGANVTEAVLTGVLEDLIAVRMLPDEVDWNTVEALITNDFADAPEIASPALSVVAAMRNRR
jgi:hypothetical protein